MHRNECWACKDSRAVCNRVRPRCSRCAKSNRQCQYGLRLSWPKTTSTKRSLTHSVKDVNTAAKSFTHASFVNATSWDIQLHDHLRISQGLSSHEGFVFQRINPAMSLSWLPTDLGYEERDLLDHFICTAPSTLAVFDPNKNEFLSLLVRLALSDSSPSSVAVLQSALALSSFHRYGLQADVLRFKARALRILIASCNHYVNVIQHIAATMILCHLEMNEMSSTVTLWFCHLSEAKALIDNAGIDSHNIRGELLKLRDWVDYHMVMSRFSLRHWHTNERAIQDIVHFAPVEQVACLSRKVEGLSHCSHEILRYLYLAFEMIRKPTDSLYHTKEYEDSLRCLETRITNMSAQEDISGSNKDWAATIELFKLTALIYLRRASRNFSGTSPQIEAMVERAFGLLDDLENFSPTFPLLVVGCEARTDEQRMKILTFIEGVMKTPSWRSWHRLRNILQQLWVQADLAADYQLNYLDKLETVITSYQIMPSFV